MNYYEETVKSHSDRDLYETIFARFKTKLAKTKKIIYNSNIKSFENRDTLNKSYDIVNNFEMIIQKSEIEVAFYEKKEFDI